LWAIRRDLTASLGRSSPPVYCRATLRFIDDWFPLVATVSAPQFDERELKSMVEGFERYFERGERYTLITVSPRNFARRDATARRDY
jgi:hypothetical protein